MYNGQEVETEDCTPTWESLLPIYLQVIRNSATDNRIIDMAAVSELIRMAQAADSWNELMKKFKDDGIDINKL